MIDTATDTVIATIPVGLIPFGVAVSPDGSKVYVTNAASNIVSVIDTATNTVIATIPVDLPPICGVACAMGVAVSPDGSKVRGRDYEPIKPVHETTMDSRTGRMFLDQRVLASAM